MVVPDPAIEVLTERLQNRRAEIEQAILSRAYSVSDPTEVGDPEYVAGLRGAVAAAVSYGFSCVGGVEETAAVSIPLALFAQVRHAARSGVSLDTILRRYFAGYTLLGEFIMEEARAGGLFEAEEIHHLSRVQAAIFDRLVVAITDEYCREDDRRGHSAEHTRTERVRRLLAGDPVDTSELGYELESHHLGLIATGSGASQALRTLAATLDRRLLLVRPDEGTAWGWLGGRSEVSADQVLSLASTRWPARMALAIGEAARGISGWRLTHRQAMAALPIGLRGAEKIVRYADVALLASIFQDELVGMSLWQLYLAPLEQERDDGKVLRETLRAYFFAERNVSSAAAALEVNRHTVTNRLHAVEERLGRSLSSCAPEVESALRLQELGYFSPPSPALG